MATRLSKKDRLEGWFPYTSEDYTMSHCKEMAATLIASGKYADVEIRRRASDKRWTEDGRLESIPFGRIYVKEKK